MTSDEATEKPVGLGRSDPNQFPTLTKPKYDGLVALRLHPQAPSNVISVDHVTVEDDALRDLERVQVVDSADPADCAGGPLHRFAHL